VRRPAVLALRCDLQRLGDGARLVERMPTVLQRIQQHRAALRVTIERSAQ
jgi:hypothetical protein